MFIDSYGSFKEQFYKLTGIDLNAYKEGQMRRRIDSLIAKNRIPGYTAFINVLKSDKEKYEEFLGYITINVSEFWRNPEQWEILEKDILPPKCGAPHVQPVTSRIHLPCCWENFCRLTGSISLQRI